MATKQRLTVPDRLGGELQILRTQDGNKTYIDILYPNGRREVVQYRVVPVQDSTLQFEIDITPGPGKRRQFTSFSLPAVVLDALMADIVKGQQEA